MKLYTAILAASLFMYVGVRNGTGERSSNDSLPRVDKFIGLLIGNWSHPYKRSHLSETMTGWRNADTVFECVINSDNEILATRDTLGKWKVYNASKALELFYQAHMEMFNRVYPEPKEPNIIDRLHAKPSPSPVPDTTKPRDTLYVPLFERSDTTNAIIVYLAPDGNVKHLTGKVIVVGIKLQTGQWADPSRLQYNFFDNKGVRMKTHIVDWYAIAAPKKESVKIEQTKGGKP